MNPTELILTGARPPALYRLAANWNADFLVEPLTRQGWRGFYIEGQVVKSKEAFLRVGSAALDFPSYSSHNWDAFEESIRDLSWAPAQGYVLIYDAVWHLAWHDREAWGMVRSILTDTVAFWRTKETPFYVLLNRTWWYAHDLEKLE
jgi:hypothetical protein